MKWEFFKFSHISGLPHALTIISVKDAAEYAGEAVLGQCWRSFARSICIPVGCKITTEFTACHDPAFNQL